MSLYMHLEMCSEYTDCMYISCCCCNDMVKQFSELVFRMLYRNNNYKCPKTLKI